MFKIVKEALTYEKKWNAKRKLKKRIKEYRKGSNKWKNKIT